MTDRETEAALDGAVDTTGEDRHWQLRLLDEVLAEEAANEELRRTSAEDPESGRRLSEVTEAKEEREGGDLRI